MIDLEKFLISSTDEETDLTAAEDLSTIRDPKVLENEKKEARRRNYMRNRSKYANSKQLREKQVETTR